MELRTRRNRRKRASGKLVKTTNVNIRISEFERERWRQAAPKGNISSWLRELAAAELRRPTDQRTVRRVVR